MGPDYEAMFQHDLGDFVWCYRILNSYVAGAYPEVATQYGRITGKGLTKIDNVPCYFVGYEYMPYGEDQLFATYDSLIEHIKERGIMLTPIKSRFQQTNGFTSKEAEPTEEPSYV